MRLAFSLPLVLYVVSLLIFGSNGLYASAISLPSREVVFLRTLFGCAPLIAAILALGPKAALRSAAERPGAAAWAALAGLAIGAGWICVFEAYRLVGVGVASLLYYTGPVLVLALGALLFRERVPRRAAAGMGAVLLGVAALSPGVAGGSGAPAAGFALGLAAAFFYAVMVLANRRAASLPGLPSALLQLASACALSALYCGLTGGVSLPAAAEWPAVLMLGCVNTGLACLLYYWAIARLPVAQVAVLGYLEPLSALFFSCAFLGERLTPLQAAGTLLILAGIAWAEHRPAAALRKAASC